MINDLARAGVPDSRAPAESLVRSKNNKENIT